ncbi:MAG: PfaB family protein [Anaerolineae bacterium]|nr:PfaB family protein [Anaerolineae bacterium]
MQIQDGQTVNRYTIIGMSVRSPHIPNLAAYRRWLLTGQLQASGEDNLPIDAQLRQVVEDALRDAGLKIQQAGNLPLVLHAPPAALSSARSDAFTIQPTVAASFEDAVYQTMHFLQESSEGLAALCSGFAEPDSGAPAGDPNGLVCLLLARGTLPGPAYTTLECNRISGPADLQPAAASLLDVVNAALSLNSRTHLAETADHHDPARLRPWFSLPFSPSREVKIPLNQGKDSNAIILDKADNAPRHSGNPFHDFGLYLLPVNLDDPQQAAMRIETVKNEIQACGDLHDYIGETLLRYENRMDCTLTLAVLGSSRAELISELERARAGLPQAIADGREWQTPLGSYFTPKPFGANTKAAFVYPGAFGTYVGMGREIFYLFPQLYDALQAISDDPASTINANVIFPPPGTPQSLEELQQELDDNPTEMISSGVCLSYLFTVILRDIFQIQPAAAFGYSLGENSMMFGVGVWSQAGAMRTSLEASPIFHERVSGAQNAIREFWRLPPVKGYEKSASLWANYALMAPPEKVREALQSEPQVYLTHINTPRQVVIGGEKEACRRVAQALGCMHLEAPYRHAIHCEPIVSEFAAFQRLHDWPVETEPDIPVYSAARYAPLAYDSKSIAESFAQMLTHTIDFPRLVELAYAQGARVFIELGAGSNCTKWIEAILKGRQFAAMTINQNGVDDHTAILRLLARLISQQMKPSLQALRGC